MPQLPAPQANKRHADTLQGCVVQRRILIQRMLGSAHSLAHKPRDDWFGSSTARLPCLFSQLGKIYFCVILSCLHGWNVSGFRMAPAWWSCCSSGENMLLKASACRASYGVEDFLFVFILILIPSPRPEPRKGSRWNHGRAKLPKSFATDCSVAGFHSEWQFSLRSLLLCGKAVNEHYMFWINPNFSCQKWEYIV